MWDKQNLIRKLVARAKPKGRVPHLGWPPASLLAKVS